MYMCMCDIYTLILSHYTVFYCSLSLLCISVSIVFIVFIAFIVILLFLYPLLHLSVFAVGRVVKCLQSVEVILE